MQSAAIHPSKASSLQMFLRTARLGLSRSVHKAALGLCGLDAAGIKVLDRQVNERSSPVKTYHSSPIAIRSTTSLVTSPVCDLNDGHLDKQKNDDARNGVLCCPP